MKKLYLLMVSILLVLILILAVIVSAPAKKTCGNNVIEVEEQCDGNSRACTINGYTGTQTCNSQCNGFGSCTTTQYCGDGIKQGNEQCDDGNTNNYDACSNLCKIQTIKCYTNSDCGSTTTSSNFCSGNNVTKNVTTYTCNNPGTTSSSCSSSVSQQNVQTCSYQCSNGACITQSSVCGNGILETGEQCDDGNLVNGDGCSSSCVIEFNSTNGIVTNIWLDNESKLDKFRQRNIKYLIVDVGGIDSTGKFTATSADLNYFLNFEKNYESKYNYHFVLLPYSEIYTYNYNINQTGFKENLVNGYVNLDSMGFNGAFVDIEPARFDQRADYINFLQKLDTAMGSKPIMVYSGDVNNDNTNEWEWSPGFYNQTSPYVDVFSIPIYDTGITDTTTYINYAKNQISQINSLNINSKVLIAVPTHKPSPETLVNALYAYNSTIKSSKIIGVDVFAEWTTDDSEWTTYDKYFPH